MDTTNNATQRRGRVWAGVFTAGATIFVAVILTTIAGTPASSATPGAEQPLFGCAHEHALVVSNIDCAQGLATSFGESAQREVAPWCGPHDDHIIYGCATTAVELAEHRFAPPMKKW